MSFTPKFKYMWFSTRLVEMKLVYSVARLLRDSASMSDTQRCFPDSLALQVQFMEPTRANKPFLWLSYTWIKDTEVTIYCSNSKPAAAVVAINSYAKQIAHKHIMGADIWSSQNLLVSSDLASMAERINILPYFNRVYFQEYSERAVPRKFSSSVRREIKTFFWRLLAAPRWTSFQICFK